jgi:hypothetical protein
VAAVRRGGNAQRLLARGQRGSSRALPCSITASSRLSGLVTKTRSPATATPAGERPTGTVATTRRWAMSTTLTSWLPWLVT